jgi:hypothetical protein
MATVEEYGSGRILRSIRLAHLCMRAAGFPLIGPVAARNMEGWMEPFGIHPITIDDAKAIIEGCRCCAAGPRVCRLLFPESAVSESVFTDELAERMAEAGKARPVTKDLAMEIIGKYPDNPLLLSKVSGRYMELCRSDPEVCIYWKMRRVITADH